MTLPEMARIIEMNGPDFASRVFASLKGANPAELFEGGAAAQDALNLLRSRRELMIAIGLWR